MLQVRVKDWWLKAHELHCEERGRGYNSLSWLSVRRETEKAYLLDSIQKYIPQTGVFVPKSCILETRILPDRNRYGVQY